MINTVEIITITDPDDLVYPHALGKDAYFDPAVYYHGTSREFSSSIESDGFKLGNQVYDKADLVELYKAYDSPYFDSMFATGKEMKMQKEDLHFVLGGAGDDMKDEPLSFSGNYWTARNYSINRGGEAIDKAVKMARWISELPDCPDQRIAEKIIKKYGHIFDNHIPCVYAVRLPDEEVQKVVEGSLNAWLEENGVPAKTPDVNHFVHNEIPKESIVARIDLSSKTKRDRSFTNIMMINDSIRPYPTSW